MDASTYDRQVDWKKRLANEWPFYRELFARHRVSAVLDCACGTGRHAVLFAKNGFEVAGIDIDEEMIRVAGENAAGEGATGVSFHKASFSELPKIFPSRRFDAVICVGNSLSQFADIDEVGDAIRNMAGVCRPAGVMVLHILNYSRLIKERIVAKPPRVIGDRGALEIHQKIFLPRRSCVEVVMLRVIEEGGRYRSEASIGKLLPIRPVDMERLVSAAGFRRIEMWGDYAGRPFNSEDSQDLIVTASREL